VTIAGFVRGNIVATSRLKITSTGRLEGDAKVGALVVQEGGVHHGVIRVHPEGVPEREDKVVIDAASRPMIVAVRSVPNQEGIRPEPDAALRATRAGRKRSPGASPTAATGPRPATHDGAARARQQE
jgi:hypothetical protein